MKTFIFSFSLILIATSSFSQTKMIAFKSHSGSVLHFKKANLNKLFNMGESNFGMAPQRHVRNSSLDTVKLLSPHVAVMITSESCHWEDYDGRDPSNTTVWSAGSDTVFDHPIFNSKNSISEIKTRLKKDYFFANSIDSVVFIGFDGKFVVAAPKKETIPTKTVNQNDPSAQTRDQKNTPKNRPSYFMIIVLAILSSIFNTPFR